MSRADVVVYSSDQQLQLVVEVKGRFLNTSLEWAVHLRRNLLVNDLVPQSPFFMLVLPDYIHMWTGTTSPDDPPEATVDAHAVLDGYLPARYRAPNPDSVSGITLQEAVWLWLTDLTFKLPSSDRSVVPAWLATSGLLARVMSGSVFEELEL